MCVWQALRKFSNLRLRADTTTLTSYRTQIFTGCLLFNVTSTADPAEQGCNAPALKAAHCELLLGWGAPSAGDLHVSDRRREGLYLLKIWTTPCCPRTCARRVWGPGASGYV